MPNDEWTDEAADPAAQAAQRSGSRGTSVHAGGARGPADVTTPGTLDEEGRTPGRQAGSDVNAPPRPGAGPQARGPHADEPDSSPVRSASAEKAPEPLGEGSDYPILYGEDPGVIGQ